MKLTPLQFGGRGGWGGGGQTLSLSALTEMIHNQETIRGARKTISGYRNRHGPVQKWEQQGMAETR